MTASAEPIEAVWRDLRGRLLGYIAARVPAQDAEDVLQDVVLRLMRSPTALDEVESPSGYVWSAVRSGVADYHRRAGRRPEVPDADAGTVASAQAPADDPDVDLTGCLDPLIGELSPVLAQAVRLVDVEGRSQEEAARLLDVPASTARARVQRGRAGLRTLLDRCCAIELDARGHPMEARPRGGRECPTCDEGAAT